MKEIILMIHPTFGVLGAIAAVWVFIEVLNISQANLFRARWASLATAVFMVITWISSGYWYVLYYAADKAVILKGPWAFAHNLVMETKEHLFFVTLILAIYLPIAMWSEDLFTNKSARMVILWTSALIFLTAMALEGMGATISLGVKMGLLQAGL